MTAPTAIAPTAIERISAERLRQVEKFGHSPEADRALPVQTLPREAQRYLTFAQDDLRFHRDNWAEHAVRHLAQAGALIAAAIDRIQAEQQPGDPI